MSSSKIRQTSVAKHRIVIEENSRPLLQSPYRVSTPKREAIKKQADEMLRDDITQPSNSPWASPMVCVKKKHGTLRFGVDYYRLNKITKKDRYLVSRLNEVLDRLYSTKYFSLMDIKNCYWQIDVDEIDQEKTVFITPDGLFEFKVMPFSLFSAPATFQRVMDTVLEGLK